MNRDILNNFNEPKELLKLNSIHFIQKPLKQFVCIKRENALRLCFFSQLDQLILIIQNIGSLQKIMQYFQILLYMILESRLQQDYLKSILLFVISQPFYVAILLISRHFASRIWKPFYCEIIDQNQISTSHLSSSLYSLIKWKNLMTRKNMKNCFNLQFESVAIIENFEVQTSVSSILERWFQYKRSTVRIGQSKNTGLDKWRTQNLELQNQFYVAKRKVLF
ncbi:unnamed protein product [Paramecium octaurelia]|uniref:Transmembrane protein n=1 Tax=Paramecium octaurelia TaxID=43137 RepID=A0A8S1XEI5_PAROT|nr:unnamed protein product [Paramecium octaurelia]